MVPSDPPPPRGTGRWWLPATIAAAVLALSLILASLVQVPYYAFEPGSARTTEDKIQVQGVDTFVADGEVLYLTVAIQPLTVLEAARAWVDPVTDVVPESFVLGDRTEEENQQVNVQAMASSKDTAAVVALEHLGYELAPTATGATVVQTTEDTAAFGVLAVGDTVTAVDDTPVRFSTDLQAAVGARRPGEPVTLAVEAEDGTARQEEVTLGVRPDDPDRAFLGVASVDRGFDPGLPFEVLIDSQQVGGPSAGLAFTLALLDVLTPGELTGGEVVATTGTIASDGTVGAVGGIPQKAAAAAAAGATVMLVPEAELQDALDHDHGMRIEAVADLDDALRVLDSLGGNALALGTPGTEGAGS